MCQTRRTNPDLEAHQRQGSKKRVYLGTLAGSALAQNFPMIKDLLEFSRKISGKVKREVPLPRCLRGEGRSIYIKGRVFRVSVSRRTGVEKTTPSLGQNSLQHPPNPILCTTKGINEFATLFQIIHFNHHSLPIHGNTLSFHFFTGISSRYKTYSPLCLSTRILSRQSFSSQEHSPFTKSLMPHSSLHGDTLPFFFSTEILSPSPSLHGNTPPLRSSLSPTLLSTGILSR